VPQLPLLRQQVQFQQNSFLPVLVHEVLRLNGC